MFRYFCQNVLKMRIKHCHLNQVQNMYWYHVKNFNHSFSTSPSPSTSIGNMGSHNSNLVSGTRDMTTVASDNLDGEGIVAQIKQSTYRLEVVRHTKFKQLSLMHKQLDELARQVNKLGNFPEERDKMICILMRKVQNEGDKRIGMLEELADVVSSSSKQRVQEFKELEEEIKVNFSRNIERINQFKNTNQGGQGDEIVITANKLLDKLKVGSDILVEQVSSFKGDVQADLEKQRKALAYVQYGMEYNFNNLGNEDPEDDEDRVYIPQS
ncbi:hypothetical protein HOY82DRAFT_595819 [Tuber indicum]|nr:hypothetical protein HOY82DRAFT_595819 [Tuber indicum]